MSGNSRTRITYLQCVENKAKEYERQGYSVKAVVEGWGNPPEIEGIIPDLRAKRGDQVIFGKFVTEKELESSLLSLKKLVRYAEQKENTSFRLFTYSDDAVPKLYKIYK